jgi:endogenous inhibitor of DNA gyrase (YacG/DUF329 family)
MFARLLDRMFNYECPHCHKRAISTWRPRSKRMTSNLRPTRAPAQSPLTIKCSECGAEVTLTLWSFFWCTLPFLALIALIWFLVGDESPIVWALYATLFLASVWVNQKFLVWVEKSPSDRMVV